MEDRIAALESTVHTCVGEAFIIPARRYGARCLSVNWLYPFSTYRARCVIIGYGKEKNGILNYNACSWLPPLGISAISLIAIRRNDLLSG